MATPVYWVGSNGNVYLKSASGVEDLGKSYANLSDNGFDRVYAGGGGQNVGATRINDPNPGVQGASSVAGGGGASTSKVDPNFVNQAYDTKIAGLQSVLDTLQPQQDAATLNVNNQYQNQSNALTTQKAQGDRNLNIASDQVQSSKAHSLNDLRSQVETMGMNYNNQLGAYGAGDSSAAQLLQQALGGMASKNRYGVMTNAAQQDQAITLQKGDLQSEFDNNLKSLGDWKNSSLNDIATKFLQQKQAIQQQMVGANADRYQALAQADAAYTNQAIAQLSNLENVYRSQASQLIGQYQQIQGPNAQINPALQQFAVQPISAGQVSNIATVPQYNTDNAGYTMPRKFNEDYGLSLQPGY